MTRVGSQRHKKLHLVGCFRNYKNLSVFVVTINRLMLIRNQWHFNMRTVSN